MSTMTDTAWRRGRLDARDAPSRLLFGRMYEDAAIECEAFRPSGRIFCIASAGCTSMALARRHDVVAVDINPVQLAYAERRIFGGAPVQGTVERLMAVIRGPAGAVGWRRSRLQAFLDLHDPKQQVAYWRQYLDTARFRIACDTLLSLRALGAVYAPQLLDFLPPRFGAVMRSRMERCFARHPNRNNPYARALLLGEPSGSPPPSTFNAIRLVCADAAAYLESEAQAAFDGFALSNILDGADAAYRTRIVAAVKRAAAPGAVVVLRSFREPAVDLSTNRAADDRSMIWGIVDVRPVATL